MKSAPIIIAKASSQRSQRIPGVLPSVRYGEQVVSTGVPSLDNYIGNGLPIGSICIIKDTFPGRFANCVLKSFLAEGAVHNHRLYVAAEGRDPGSIVNDLPQLLSSSGDADHGAVRNPQDVDIKIAWRYTHQDQSTFNKGSKQQCKFDFSKKCSAADLGASFVSCSQLFGNSVRRVGPYEVLKEIYDVVSPLTLPYSLNKPSSQVKPPSNLVRIALSYCEETVLSNGFMVGLRSLVRHTNSCAVITMLDVGDTSERFAKCEHFADCIINLQAVGDDKRRSELGDIDGLCYIKMSPINVLKPIEPPQDIGFSFRRKKLIFQELSLPPEGEDTMQRESSNKITISRPESNSGSCGKTLHGKSIDF